MILQPSAKSIEVTDGRSKQKSPSRTTRPVFASKKSSESDDGVNQDDAKSQTKNSESAKSFLLGTVKVLFEAMELYGFKQSDSDRSALLQNTVDLWFTRLPVDADELVAIKFVKYKLAAYFSAHRRVELPDYPFSPCGDLPHVLVGGRAYRWQRLFALHDPETFLSFLTTVSIGVKKGAPRPSKGSVRKSVLSTFKLLTTAQVQPKPIPMVWADEIEDDWSNEKKLPEYSLDDVKREITRTVEEVFAGEQSPLVGDIRDLRFPSVAASFFCSRGELGQVGDLLFTDPIIGKFFHDRSLKPETLLRPSLDDQGEYIEFDDTRLRAWTRELDMLCLQVAETEKPSVRLVGLAESLKVRVISAGPAVSSFLMSTFQKWMWRVLSKQRCFYLIGNPVTEGIMNDVIGHLVNDEEFASIDYSAATDMINPVLSTHCVNEIGRVTHMGDQTLRIFNRLLVGHEITNPADYGKSKYRDETGKTRYDLMPTVPQLWAQLMGSVVSFPILCLLNAAILRRCCEISRPRLVNGFEVQQKLGEVPLLVNGDDGGTRLTPKAFFAWKCLAAIYSFKPSLGKTFFSKQFIQINSRNFEYCSSSGSIYTSVLSGKIRTSSFRLTPFVNFGLLYGYKRSSSRSDEPDDIVDREGFSIGSRARQLYDESPPFLREKIMERFRQHNRRTLDLCQFPWFLPEELGGLGLPGTPSHQDFCVCVHLLNRYMEGLEIDVPSWPTFTEWMTRRSALGYLSKTKIPRMPLLGEDEVRENVRCTNLLCAATLFDPRLNRSKNGMYRTYRSLTTSLACQDAAHAAKRFFDDLKKTIDLRQRPSNVPVVFDHDQRVFLYSGEDLLDSVPRPFRAEDVSRLVIPSRDPIDYRIRSSKKVALSRVIGRTFGDFVVVDTTRPSSPVSQDAVDQKEIWPILPFDLLSFPSSLEGSKQQLDRSLSSRTYEFINSDVRRSLIQTEKKSSFSRFDVPVVPTFRSTLAWDLPGAGLCTSFEAPISR